MQVSLKPRQNQCGPSMALLRPEKKIVSRQDARSAKELRPLAVPQAPIQAMDWRCAPKKTRQPRGAPDILARANNPDHPPPCLNSHGIPRKMPASICSLFVFGNFGDVRRLRSIASESVNDGPRADLSPKSLPETHAHNANRRRGTPVAPRRAVTFGISGNTQ
jgi:hypothetical protein